MTKPTKDESLELMDALAELRAGTITDERRRWLHGRLSEALSALVLEGTPIPGRYSRVFWGRMEWLLNALGATLKYMERETEKGR